MYLAKMPTKSPNDHLTTSVTSSFQKVSADVSSHDQMIVTIKTLQEMQRIKNAWLHVSRARMRSAGGAGIHINVTK